VAAALKFKGKIEELKTLVDRGGFEGDWSDGGNGNHQFRAANGAILNWSPTKGSIWFQGPGSAKTGIEAALTPLLNGQPSSTPSSINSDAAPRSHIFVVHGHDKVSVEQLELALRRLGLEPFILMNSTGEGKTIIEALENKIGRDFTSDFGIVLFTPDDMGYAKQDGPEKVEPRARQNVVLETGMLLASLTRERMAILVKGHIELPSDLQGIIQFHFNEHVREVVAKLANRLKEAGIKIDPHKIAAATA
jgi:predicted nucleotide-binding protein